VYVRDIFKYVGVFLRNLCVVLRRDEVFWLVLGVLASVVALFDLCICPMWYFRVVAGIILAISMVRCPCVIVAVFVVSILSGDILTGGILISVLSILWVLRWLGTSV